MGETYSSAGAVRQFVAQGELGKARELIDSCAAAGPLTPELRMLDSDLLAQGGDLQSAEEALRAAIEDAPTMLSGWLRLVRLLLKRRNMIEAQQIFADRIWGSTVSHDIQDRLVNQLTSGTDIDPDVALAFLQRLGGEETRRPSVLIRKSVFLSRQLDAVAAFEALSRARDIAPLPLYAAALHAELLLTVDQGSSALSAAKELVIAEPDNPRLAEMLIHAAAVAGDMNLATDALRTALKAFPADHSLLRRFNRLPFGPEAVAELFAIVAANAAAQPLNASARFHYALACLEQERIDEARDILNRLSHEQSHAHIAGPLVRALSVLAREPPVSRVVMDRRSGISTVVTPGADTLLVLFTGQMGRFGYLPISLLDGFLARYRTHVAYLNDVRDAAYLTGVDGLGASEDEAVAGLRAVASNLGVSRIVTMGGSVGGLAAMRYGAKLQAEAVVSLGGPTLLDNAKVRLDLPPHVRRRRGRVTGRIDVFGHLAAAPNMRVFYVYAALRPSHRTQVGRLKQVPGVVFLPLKTDSPFTAMDAMASGSLAKLLSSELGLSDAA